MNGGLLVVTLIRLSLVTPYKVTQVPVCLTKEEGKTARSSASLFHLRARWRHEEQGRIKTIKNTNK